MTRLTDAEKRKAALAKYTVDIHDGTVRPPYYFLRLYQVDPEEEGPDLQTDLELVRDPGERLTLQAAIAAARERVKKRAWDGWAVMERRGLAYDGEVHLWEWDSREVHESYQEITSEVFDSLKIDDRLQELTRNHEARTNEPIWVDVIVVSRISGCVTVANARNNDNGTRLFATAQAAVSLRLR